MNAPSVFVPRARFVIIPILLTIICCAVSMAQDATAAQAVAATPRPLIMQPLDEAQLTTLKGNTHPMARREFDLGTAPASLPLQRMLLVLKRSPDQEFALRKLLDDQQDKASPNYHKWLTPEQFGKQFGPTDADIQTVTSWLQTHGFQVAAPSKGRTVIEFSGSASQVQEAFHTTIHKYIVKGQQHWANASDPMIPTALAPAVAGVDSLHSFGRKPMSRFFGVVTREKATGKITAPAKPDFTFAPGGANPCNGQDNNCYAVGPFDFATIYNVTPQWTAGIDGTGQRIAIVQETNIDIADAQAFRAMFGLPPKDPNIILNGPDPGILLPGSFGIESEADIDVQWSGAVAKGATIDLVVSSPTDTTAGIDLSSVYIVDNNLDGIVSESFGTCEPALGVAGNQFYNAVWQQAAAQGISVFVSSGDQGSAGCDFSQGFVPQPAVFGLAVNGIASTPFNVAVGGTDFQDVFNPETYWNLTNTANQASAIGYIPETAWNDTCTNSLFATAQGGSASPEANCNNPNFVNFVTTAGGSGGASIVYPKPSWQTGTGVPADLVRDLPDVSLFAADGFEGNFYIYCQGDLTPTGSCDLNSPFADFGGVGGTSVSTPAMAGIMAMINQKTGTRQGNPNYVFYKLAAQTPATSCNSTSGPAAACIFNDVTDGTIRVPCTTGTPDCTTTTGGDPVGIINGYDTTTGYDLATGLGTVNVNNLVNQWHTATFTATTTTLALNLGSPVLVMHGTSIPVQINVTHAGSGTATGDVSLIAQTGPSISNQTGLDMFTLSSGATPPGSATSRLPGGTYSVKAHYEGDGTFGASDSNAVPVTVTAENSATAVSVLTADAQGNPIPFTSGPFGSFVYVKANVAGLSGSGTPTGSVTFSDTFGAIPGGTSQFSLNSEGATSVANGNVNFDAGNHTISAIYSGDASFHTSSSTQSQSFTITPGFFISTLPTDVTIANPGGQGSTSIGVTASAGFGTVTFTCSGLPLEAACLSASVAGTGSATITITTQGPHTTMLQANQRPYYVAMVMSGGLPLAGIFLLTAPRRRRWGVLLGLLVLACLVVLPACGGGGGGGHQLDPGTPIGMSNVTVTASGGGLSASTNIVLTVN